MSEEADPNRYFKVPLAELDLGFMFTPDKYITTCTEFAGVWLVYFPHTDTTVPYSKSAHDQLCPNHSKQEVVEPT